MSDSFQISVDIVGEKELLEALGGVEKGLLNLNDLGVWKKVQYEFFKIEKELFESAGSSGPAGKWAPLTSKYAAVKNKKYGGPTRLMIASGMLYKSLTSPGTGPNAAIFDTKPLEVTLGSSVPWGAIHNAKDRGKSTSPRRALMDFNEEQQKRLAQPIKDALKQLVDNAKLRSLRGF